jgi:hypothetical protein
MAQTSPFQKTIDELIKLEEREFIARLDEFCKANPELPKKVVGYLTNLKIIGSNNFMEASYRENRFYFEKFHKNSSI